MSSIVERITSGALTRSRLQGQRSAKPNNRSTQMFVKADATHSMKVYIEAVKATMAEFLVEISKKHRSMKLGCGFYRDHTCDRPFDFFGGESSTSAAFVKADEAERLRAFLMETGHTEGNVTYPEALGAAFHHVSQFPWSARNRVVVSIGDMPSHGFAARCGKRTWFRQDTIENCPLRMTHDRILACLKATHLRCYMVRCGGDDYAEAQYRDIAEKTGGRFIDFKDLKNARDLIFAVEASLEDATGGDARKLIEAKAARGQIEATSARLLLESFGDA